MNDLLRLANELMALDNGQEAPFNGWPCHGKYPCMYGDDAITVIRGYQELLRRLVNVFGGKNCVSIERGYMVIQPPTVVNELIAAVTLALESLPPEKNA